MLVEKVFRNFSRHWIFQNNVFYLFFLHQNKIRIFWQINLLFFNEKSTYLIYVKRVHFNHFVDFLIFFHVSHPTLNQPFSLVFFLSFLSFSNSKTTFIYILVVKIFRIISSFFPTWVDPASHNWVFDRKEN